MPTRRRAKSCGRTECAPVGPCSNTSTESWLRPLSLIDSLPMPSLEHNGLVDLFRKNPELGAHMLDVAFGVAVPPHSTARVTEGTLDQLVPIEFRADLVTELKSAGDRVELSIIVEVQLSEDPTKKYSWPVYAATERARKRSPACVLVVAPDEKVARWAAEPLDVGLGRGSCEPFVLGPAALPKVTDPVVAERERELAILSAVAHGNDEVDGVQVLLASFAALAQFDQEAANVYLQIIYEALREPMRKALEAMMERIHAEEVNLPPFAKKLIARGEALGEERGKLEGKLEGKREALLLLVKRLGLTLSEEQRERIAACDDVTTVDRWLDRVVGAKSVDDLFA